MLMELQWESCSSLVPQPRHSALVADWADELQELELTAI